MTPSQRRQLAPGSVFRSTTTKITAKNEPLQLHIFAASACLISIPAEEHGVLQEEDRRHQCEVAEPERKREEVDVEQRKVQEEHLRHATKKNGGGGGTGGG